MSGGHTKSLTPAGWLVGKFKIFIFIYLVDTITLELVNNRGYSLCNVSNMLYQYIYWFMLFTFRSSVTTIDSISNIRLVCSVKILFMTYFIQGILMAAVLPACCFRSRVNDTEQFRTLVLFLFIIVTDFEVLDYNKARIELFGYLFNNTNNISIFIATIGFMLSVTFFLFIITLCNFVISYKLAVDNERENNV